MRVLVTGGAGFIGSHLVEASLRAGDEVRVLDDLSTGRLENLDAVSGEIDLRRGSVTDGDAVAAACTGCEVAYHLAALPSVPQSVDDPLGTHHVNLTGTLRVLEAARCVGLRRVVYVSSCAVYGNAEDLPLREDHPPDARSPYALQKLMGEAWCRLFSDLYGLETLALRYFNVFGPRQSPDSDYAGVVPLFLTALAKGDAPTVYGDGGQSRDFVHVKDVVAATRSAGRVVLESGGQVVNVACGRSITILELLAEVCRAAGREPVEPHFAPARAGEVRHSRADIGRARRLLGWSPAVELGEGLAGTLHALRATVGP